VFFSPDGHIAAIFHPKDADDYSHLYDINQNRIICPLLKETKLYAAAFTPDTKYIVLGLAGKAVLLDTKSGKTIRSYNYQSDSIPVTSLDVSSDGRFVLTAGDSLVPILWDIQTGNVIGRCKYGSSSLVS